MCSEEDRYGQCTLAFTGRPHAQHLFALAVEAAPNAMLLVDRDGRIILVNTQAERVFGYAREELLGQSMALLVPARYQRTHSGYFAQFWQRPSVRPMGAGRDLWGRRKDGTEVPIEVGLTPMQTGAGSFVLAAIVDITERQRLEREAQRATHFALLGRLAASLSHDLRNPLSAAMLHVDLVEGELRAPSPDSPEQTAQSLAEIRTQLARLDDLVQDYLSLARLANITRTPQDLGAAVQTWVTEWQAFAASRGITVHLDGLETLGQMAFHAHTLRRAVDNLIQNALEAMAPGGTLTLVGQGTASQVQLQIRDTGSGIPAARLQQVFEPLYTTKPEGTGLGLYIAQEIVAVHGVQITVQSTKEQGTTFTFTLPRAAAAPGDQPVQPDMAASARGRAPHTPLW
jgi:PAS domain S-box-containing protein